MINEIALQTFAEKNRGQHYNAVRSGIESMDWDGWYPEINTEGCLTGCIIPADQYGYSVCDVSDEAVCVHSTAADAVIVD